MPRYFYFLTKTGSNISFEYNASGVRTRKTVNGVVHNYYLNGTNILPETIERGVEADVLEYIYDGNGEIGGLRYNGESYEYIRNLQGDVIRVVDSTGKGVVKYVYDAWGKAEKIQDGNGRDIGSNAGHIGNINPIRYRGYYYDQDTGLYYLNTRYYSPEWRRFISPDDTAYLDSETPNGLNLYVYCGNNPVMYVDPNGTFVVSLVTGLIVSFVVGFSVSTVSQGIQYGWDNINWCQSIVDGLFTVGSTALAATGIGFAAAVGIGAAMGFGQYVIDSAFHNQPLTLSGALISIGIGAITGIIGGAGASNGKVLAKGMTGRAASGMKAVITTVNRYGINSTAYRNIMNLYGKAISASVQNTINNAFTKSVIKIGGSTIVASIIQYWVGKLFN